MILIETLDAIYVVLRIIIPTLNIAERVISIYVQLAMLKCQEEIAQFITTMV